MWFFAPRGRKSTRPHRQPESGKSGAVAQCGTRVPPAPQGNLTPDAALWLASLPADVRIRALVGAAPGLANDLAAAWKDASATSTLLEEILLGEGCGAVPSPIVDELLRLHAYHMSRRTEDAPVTSWEMPAPGLEAWYAARAI